MELRHIRYFLALVEEGNFTRAAGRVGIAQSPFSSQIRDLEREVGAALFHRLPHGAELTDAGRAFLEVVRPMPETTEQATRAARRAARGETGSLAVGFTAASAFNTVVPRAVRAFRRAYPDVALRLEEANTTRLVAALNDGRLDAAFVRPGAPGLDGLRLRLVSEEPMVAAMPASHPAASQEVVSLAELGTDLVLFPREIGSVLYDTVVGAYRAAGLEPRVVQYAPQIASTLNLVAAELGVTLAPACMAQLTIAGVVYRPIADEPPVAPLALAARRDNRNPAVPNFNSCALA